MIIPGTTGSGKSSMILGLITNALSHGSGVFEIDAKGDLKFMHQVLALARLFGRDADVRILNFLNTDPYQSESFNSNTFNMLSMAPADDVSAMISSMRVSMGTDNKVFEGRGTAVVSAVVGARVWLRDNLNIPLSIVDLRDCITNLDRLMGLAFGCDENAIEYSVRPDFWQYSDAIWTYLITFMSPADLVSYAVNSLNIDVKKLKFLDPKKKKIELVKLEPEKKVEMQKQHGFATLAFTPVFQNMIGDYKRIFGCNNGDVTIDDAVKNRRIVIALLPSLGKSRSDALSASKILVSNIRGMASRALGTRTYGNMRTLLDSQITNANSPHLIVFEEAGPYVQEGMDQLYQQSRSLNFWIATCFQDLPGLERNDRAIAQSIIGNGNYALFMRLQDPTFTGKLARDMGEQEYTSLIRSFEEKRGMLESKRSVDTPNVSIERMERVTFRDLQSQKVGQATMIAEGKVVRINAFYCEPLSCVPTHLITSRIGRFASWRLPFLSEIILVPEGQTAIAGGAAKPKHLASEINTKNEAGRPAITGPQTAIVLPAVAAIEKRIQNAVPENPIFAPSTPAPEFREANLGPVSDSKPDRAAPKGKMDLYEEFLSGLRASQASRIDMERTSRTFLGLQMQRTGVVPAWDEFLNLSYVGTAYARQPRATMDIGTMTLGLLCLAGIRIRYRRDGKLPPYLPKSWTSRRALQEQLSMDEIMNIPGAEADLEPNMFMATGRELTEYDEMPSPMYTAQFDDRPEPLDELEGDGTEEGDDQVASSPLSAEVPEINAELMGLLDRKS